MQRAGGSPPERLDAPGMPACTLEGDKKEFRTAAQAMDTPGWSTPTRARCGSTDRPCPLATSITAKPRSYGRDVGPDLASAKLPPPLA